MSLVFFFFGFFTPTVMHGYMNLKQIFRAKSCKSEQQKKKNIKEMIIYSNFLFCYCFTESPTVSRCKSSGS